MIKANQYRTVTCGELREENIGQEVRVAGWVENIRDHGGRNYNGPKVAKFLVG